MTVSHCTEIKITPETVYLQRTTADMLGRHKPADDALLQYLSPHAWEHIDQTGDYLWRSSAKVHAGRFRPLPPLNSP